MKSILIAFGLVLALPQNSLHEVDIPTDDEGNALYQDVNEVAGVSQADLYKRSLEWINEFYVNPKGVIKNQDEESFIVEGKARFKLKYTNDKGETNPNAGYVAYQLKLEAKEGKYRYTFRRIRWESASYYDVTKWKDKTQAHYNEQKFHQYLDQTATYFDDLIINLEDYMKTGKEEKSDDW